MEPRDKRMAKLEEQDMMVCRSCGNEERASEGYPCMDCGTFICVVCNMRGIERCKECREKQAARGGGAKPA
jgi:predicted RNA-binding Zn-ribbon protein involved in translation (DUF1610 family)